MKSERSVGEAWRGLMVFASALVPLTFVSAWLLPRMPKPILATVAFPLAMEALFSYSPAIASIIARVSLKEGFRDVSFRIRGEWITRGILIAWLWPVLCGALIYGCAWIAGFTRLQWASGGTALGSWGPENLVGVTVADMAPWRGLVVRLAACLVFVPFACLQSLGEELGWRGYMLTRLFDTKIRVPVFWSGLVWGLWHIPFLLAWPARHPPESRFVSTSFFVAGTIALGYLVSYLRLRSGSIWPSVVAHASNNTFLMLGFDGFTSANTFWKGELYLLTVGVPVVFLMFSRQPWVVRYVPDRTPAGPRSIIS